MDSAQAKRANESLGASEQRAPGVSCIAFGIGEKMITAKKYLEVTDVKHTSGFRLKIQFNDGTSKEVDLSALLKTPPPVFEPLRDEKTFAKIFVSPVGGIYWECGADLSAEYLKDYR